MTETMVCNGKQSIFHGPYSSLRFCSRNQCCQFGFSEAKIVIFGLFLTLWIFLFVKRGQM